MNPTVEAAWIAGGAALVGVLAGVAGTTIVGVVGFRNTRRATEDTNRTTTNTVTDTIAAAREDRLYDKRAEVYIDLMKMVAYHRERRDRMGQALAARDTSAAIDLEPITSDHHMIEARLEAFGTVGAYRLVQIYDSLATEAEDAWLDRENLGDETCLRIIRRANDAAHELIGRLRDELVGPGPALPDNPATSG